MNFGMIINPYPSFQPPSRYLHNLKAADDWVKAFPLSISTTEVTKVGFIPYSGNNFFAYSPCNGVNFMYCFLSLFIAKFTQ